MPAVLPWLNPKHWPASTNGPPIRFYLFFFCTIRFSFFVLPALLLGAGFEHSRTAATAPSAPEAPASNGTHSLAVLWHPSGANEAQVVHNGFYGKSRQRLELVFTSVRRDAKNPNLYYVRGKDRRFRKVQSFDGTFSFDKVTLSARHKAAVAKGGTEMITPGLAVGTFVLREKTSASDREPGTFQEKIAVDFLIEDSNKLVFNSASTSELTRNAGMLLEGRWNSATDTKYSVSVLVQEGDSVINSQLMPNFDIGDRSRQINPRYTRPPELLSSWDGRPPRAPHPPAPAGHGPSPQRRRGGFNDRPTGLFRVLPWHSFSFAEKGRARQGPGDEAPAEGDHPKNLTALPLQPG